MNAKIYGLIFCINEAAAFMQKEKNRIPEYLLINYSEYFWN